MDFQQIFFVLHFSVSGYNVLLKSKRSQRGYFMNEKKVKERGETLHLMRSEMNEMRITE